MTDTIMQIVGLAAGILALIVSVIAFVKAGGGKNQLEDLEDRVEELESSGSSSSKKRKKRSRS